MLILRVYNGEVPQDLDLYESQPINLQYRFSNIEKIQAQDGDFSQTFRIPATERNIDFFGTYWNVNTFGGFNAKLKTQAILIEDTIPIMSGFIQLKKVYIQKEKFADFELVFFGDKASLSRSLSEKKLTDLDLSDYDHEVNYTAISNSWAGTLFSGDIRYGLIDRGASNTYSNITQSNPLAAQDFTPFIRTKVLVEQILSQSGYSVEGDWIDNIPNLYTPLLNGSANLQIENQNIPYQFAAGATTDNDYAIIGDTLSILTLSDADPFYDNNGDFTSNEFTPTFDGFHFFDYRVLVEVSTTFGTSMDVAVVIRNVTDGVDVFLSDYEIVNDGASYLFQGVANIDLDSTKSYSLAVRSYNENGTLSVLGNDTFNETYWRLNFIEAVNAFVLDTAFNCPDIKQIDYLTSLQKMFNLVFVPSKTNPSAITIEPWNDYVGGGVPKSWTHELDYSKDVVIYPTTDLQKRRYEFTYSPDKDFLNKFYIDNADRTFGRYLIEDEENDFAVGEQKVQPTFGAYPLQELEGTGSYIHRSIDENGVTIKDPLCKVVYWGGLQPSANIWVNNGGANELTDYPYFGHYSVPNPDVADTDLNFGNEIPTYPINANPYNNLYNTYWRTYVNQLYSSEARIMEAYFKLTASDLYTFNYSDRIWIKDAYWQVLEIDYSPTNLDVTRVKLLKVLDDIRQCAELPFQSNASGLITFQDANGDTTITPSQQCCELFGYVYIDGNCFREGGDNIIRPRQRVLNGFEGINVGGINEGASRNFLMGRSLESSFNDVLAIGSNTLAIAEGFHRGAGWFNGEFGDGGNQQFGAVTFSYVGDFNNADEVELLVEGKTSNRLALPLNTALAVRFDVCVMTESLAGGLDKAQTEVFYDMLKMNGTAQSATGGSPFNPLVSIGSLSNNKVQLIIDTTTDTSEHRIIAKNNGLTNTLKTRIVCVMNYTMAKL